MSALATPKGRVSIPLRHHANREIADGILRDIHAALAVLLESGRGHAIDLRQRRRMTAQTYRHLKETLGRGEVSAVVNAGLKVEVEETAFPAVWWVRHLDDEGHIVTELVEIATIPSILCAHRAEITAGAHQLQRALEGISDSLRAENTADTVT